MTDVYALDLEIAKGGHNLHDRQVIFGLHNIKQAWNILLDVKRDLQRLEADILDAPEVAELRVCDIFEVVDLLDKFVHVCLALVKDLVLRILYTDAPCF